MTAEELLAALRTAAAQGDEKAAWMLRILNGMEITNWTNNARKDATWRA